MKYIRLKSFVMLAGMFCLAGCEGYRVARGVVLDKATGMPLDSVRCEALTGSETVITDSTGRFVVANPFGGCVPKCPDIVVQFSRHGYRTLQVTNPSDTLFTWRKNKRSGTPGS